MVPAIATERDENAGGRRSGRSDRPVRTPGTACPGHPRGTLPRGWPGTGRGCGVPRAGAVRSRGAEAVRRRDGRSSWRRHRAGGGAGARGLHAGPGGPLRAARRGAPVGG
ncbi:hypothetical protein GCM10010273_38460 [Streptomyces lavendulocolor]